MSAPTTVESLWAIMITVLPAMSLSNAIWIKCSFSGSENAVASSSTTMGASEMIERAMAIRCCSPSQAWTPRAMRSLELRLPLSFRFAFATISKSFLP